ncbi:GDP-mannose 4,6-dehydratase [Luteolibacter pohnpeiensis]|uniref:GDP-mannose 4,6-dehydratase n=1 Tax=Luteolibacter pohnpeiensis TaxID=454153 RepID=A0A934VVR2_9BACT|nr:GDP-mannose 4,6-dehydratase [Luteolibacter pohnpeiensis]MBK1882470.1 GDP-mannose 4,6-dehydratase [Luteolibacter pohnpeiensis]
MSKRALISGITGQDGSYLAELLLEKGYEVHGLVRRSSQFNRARIEHLRSEGKKLELHYADLGDQTTLRRIFNKIEPDEFYHLAGQSHVGLSFEIPESTVAETAIATLGLLEICRDLKNPPRFFHAASSEVFGVPADSPQTEETPFRPVNPYGCAKAFAANLCKVYRQAHGMFIVNGILYNHESPRRGENFVTKKIVSTVARISRGSDEILELGNLDSERDWGYAPEFVDAIWRTLQHNKADDYIIATGTSTTVRNFAISAFSRAGITLEFSGSGENEKAVDSKSKRVLLRVNPKFFRPVDSHLLMGDASRIRQTLGWKPSVTGILVAKEMLNELE